MEIWLIVGVVVLVIFSAWYVHDRYVQREQQILVNYPIVGHLRFLFQEVREPFRQYFGDEKFYESKDKLDWVYKASRNKSNFASFSPSQPLPKPKFMLRHTTIVLNDDEVNNNFNVVFGKNQKKPYSANTIIARGAMSDGSLSPEATRAFVKGSAEANFPINTGEGGLTSNFFITHLNYDNKYMDIVTCSEFHKKIFRTSKKLFNMAVATDIYRKLIFKNNPESETYILDAKKLHFYRPNWNVPLALFPENVPVDMPDIILQISSGLYGVRNKKGEFDENRYAKQMAFCKMTEIKIAQGAKQTGGKLTADKVTPAIAYYRNVDVNVNLFSSNRFPYANSLEELFDFIGKLQGISEKPVGIKIVISDYNNIIPIAEEIRKRKAEKLPFPDFISIDGGSGGSATAPIEMMERIGLNIRDSVYLVNKILEEYDIRDDVKIVASGKLLTPDDIVIILSLGADFTQIARGFMMSAGCIRARYCSGTDKHQCPVGLATQDKRKRKHYFVQKHATHIKNYHNNLLKSIRGLLAVMGLEDIKELDKDKLIFLDKDSRVHDNIDKVFERRLDIGKDNS